MKILNPEAFWWLLILIPIVMVLVYNYWQGRSTFQALTGRWRNQKVANSYVMRSFFVSAFYILAIVFLILGAVDFSWGNQPVKEDREGLEIVFLVDVSRSMLADDGTGSRLEKSMDFMNGVMQYFPDAWYGISVFKGQGLKLVPVTEDTLHLKKVLPHIGPGLMTTPGTNLEDGLKTAYESFSPKDNHNRIIVLFSDGESLEGDPVKFSYQLGKQGIPVYSIGIGQEDGNIIALPDGSVVKDQSGKPVISALNPLILQNISEASQGLYYDYSDSLSLSKMAREIESYLGALDYEGFRLIAIPQYGFFLIFSLVFFSLYLFVRIRRWKRVN